MCNYRRISTIPKTGIAIDHQMIICSPKPLNFCFSLTSQQKSYDRKIPKVPLRQRAVEIVLLSYVNKLPLPICVRPYSMKGNNHLSHYWNHSSLVMPS